MKSQATFSILFVLCLASVEAFAPGRPVLTPARLIQGNTLPNFVLRAEEKSEATEAAKPKIDADGTYFDDEVCTQIVVSGAVGH